MPSDGRPCHGGWVLVCDDNPLMAEVICEFLRESGLEPIGRAGELERDERAVRRRDMSSSQAGSGGLRWCADSGATSRARCESVAGSSRHPAGRACDSRHT